MHSKRAVQAKKVKDKKDLPLTSKECKKEKKKFKDHAETCLEMK